MQETYAYDADGTRVSRTRGTVTTIYLGGLVEQEGNTTRTLYVFHGQVIAQREGSTVLYLHGDHLGSISVATSATGAVVSKQEYTPWGEVRSGGIGQTTLNYTGQRRDGTGLLFYGARYYDPGLARFVSADTIVPGASGGVIGPDDAKLTPLTVDFHEPDFASTAADENVFTAYIGFWFQLTKEDQQAAKDPWGPRNAQALNRYTYVLNNPLRYTDPTGHCSRDMYYDCDNAGYTYGTGTTAQPSGAPVTAPGGLSTGEAVAAGAALAAGAAAGGAATVQYKGEYIPPNLNGSERIAYRRAIHRYKQKHHMAPGANVPKEICDQIAALIKSGLPADEAADLADDPPEGTRRERKQDRPRKSNRRSRSNDPDDDDDVQRPQRKRR